jgi:surface antigen
MTGLLLKGMGGLLGLVLLTGAAFNAYHQDQTAGNECVPSVPCVSVAGNQVAAEATLIAKHLTPCGQFHQDKCYGSDMPGSVLAYWNGICPAGSDCWYAWQSGNVQCVILVVAAYGLAGDTLPATGNAIDFWTLYADRSGWVRIPDGTGVPAPGDMMVFDTPNTVPNNGHIAIVVQVQGTQVTIAEANGPGQFVTGVLSSQNTISFGDQLAAIPLGYLRHVGLPNLPQASGEAAFVCAALPFAQLAASDITAGPQAQPHPWYVSVILAQWGVEQGWQMPSMLDGYNVGNVSAIPGQPSVGGTGQPGSPASFAYASTPQQGVADYVLFVQNGLYTSVAAAYPGGPQAQAVALGESPWDAGHYAISGGGPGASLIAAITTYHLTQYDQPGATC